MRILVAAATWGLCLASSCTRGAEGEGRVATDAPVAMEGREGTDPTEGTVGPTYWRDVRPVLDRTCARCHSDEGTVFSLDDVATARAMADAIAAVTSAGRMPPAAPDPSCAPYDGSETLMLTDAERLLLATWAANGAPEGNAADAPAAGPPETTAPFDAELRGEAPYTPTFADGENDYRCFDLALGNTSRTYLTGFEALVDEPRTVHHVVLWRVSAGYTAPPSGDGRPGFACDGFGESNWGFVAGWAPGGRPVTFPAGMGVPLAADTRFVIQMHYYASSAEASTLPDQSGYGLHLADDVETPIYEVTLGVEDFVVPAGDADHEETMSLPWAWGDVGILAVFPHMHVLGSGFEVRVLRGGGGETCVVEMNGWDFHNQQAVVLDEPVIVRGGDVLEVACRWDNSAANPAQPSDPPVDVGFGEGTGDEMCYAFTYAFVP